MTQSATTLPLAWLQQLATQPGLTRAEFSEVVHRMDGSQGGDGGWRGVVLAMTDAGLLQLWHAASKSVDAGADHPAFREVKDFAWSEVIRRANDSLTDAG